MNINYNNLYFIDILYNISQILHVPKRLSDINLIKIR